MHADAISIYKEAQIRLDKATKLIWYIKVRPTGDAARLGSCDSKKTQALVVRKADVAAAEVVDLLPYPAGESKRECA